jgi:chromosome segregation ATPase
MTYIEHLEARIDDLEGEVQRKVEAVLRLSTDCIEWNRKYYDLKASLEAREEYIVELERGIRCLTDRIKELKGEPEPLPWGDLD